MDPNVTYGDLQQSVRRYQRYANGEIPQDRYDLAWELDQLAEKFEALDDWLRKGGFLPDAWEIGRKRAQEGK